MVSNRSQSFECLSVCLSFLVSELHVEPLDLADGVDPEQVGGTAVHYLHVYIRGHLRPLIRPAVNLHIEHYIVEDLEAFCSTYALDVAMTYVCSPFPFDA